MAYRADHKQPTEKDRLEVDRTVDQEETRKKEPSTRMVTKFFLRHQEDKSTPGRDPSGTLHSRRNRRQSQHEQWTQRKQTEEETSAIYNNRKGDFDSGDNNFNTRGWNNNYINNKRNWDRRNRGGGRYFGGNRSDNDMRFNGRWRDN